MLRPCRVTGGGDLGRGRELAGRIGSVGVWTRALQFLPAREEQRAVREFEALGYPTVWIPESHGGKEVLAHAGLLLAGSDRTVLATGIANLWVRDPMAMANGARALAEAYPGRFVLGIGVSSAPTVARRGWPSPYERPLHTTRAYLEAMDAAHYTGPLPRERVPRVLAALGARMLELAASMADGAHTYFVPVEHTALARETLGPDPVLAVEQTAVLERDASSAREAARAFASFYLALPHYAGNLRRLGWSEEDVGGGGSDRLIDAVIAWGDADAIAARVRAHLQAAADHVCVQVVSADGTDSCLPQYRELAAALLQG